MIGHPLKGSVKKKKSEHELLQDAGVSFPSFFFSRFSSFLSFFFFGKSDAASPLTSPERGAQQLARRKHLSVAAHAYPSGKNLKGFRDSQIFEN